MDTRLDKADILNLLHTEYGRLQATLAKLTPEQMLQPNVVGYWSVKDVLAHLVFWNRYPVMELQHALQGKIFEFDHSEPDRINAVAVAQYEARSLDDVKADFAETFKEIVAAIEALSDADFASSSQLEQALGDTVAEAFSNNTFEHYPLHEAQIRAWIAGKGID
jgi:uncharacterized protein (TIGR03083 family)